MENNKSRNTYRPKMKVSVREIKQGYYILRASVDSCYYTEKAFMDSDISLDDLKDLESSSPELPEEEQSFSLKFEN